MQMSERVGFVFIKFRVTP